jgi:hypothetical protein
MTERQLHPDDGVRADLAVTKAELTMARRVDGRFELAARNATLVTAVVVYAVLVIAGVWLRGRLVPQGWQVGAACALVAVLAWAGPWLAWVTGRKPPGWAASAEICERALTGRLPAETMEVVSRVIGRIRARGGRRWHAAHVYLSRCTSTEPPDAGVCQTAGVVPMNGRLVVVIGEHMASGPAVITEATLAHESQHVRPVRMYLAWLGMLIRLPGWVILGWAVPWPALLPAALALHVAATVLSWAIEISCDLGGAADAGADAMLATLDHLSQTVTQLRKDRSRSAWYARAALMWIAGPTHPPLPLRRALLRLRWPLACAE